jgi:AcrR family transcriptional regulator
MPRKSGPQITVDEVVGAAAIVLARDGYEGLTMRAVAAELGVRAPSTGT